MEIQGLQLKILKFETLRLKFQKSNFKFWIFWISWKFKVWNPNLKICNSKIKMWKSKFKVTDFNV